MKNFQRSGTTVLNPYKIYFPLMRRPRAHQGLKPFLKYCVNLKSTKLVRRHYYRDFMPFHPTPSDQTTSIMYWPIICAKVPKLSPPITEILYPGLMKNYMAKIRFTKKRQSLLLRDRPSLFRPYIPSSWNF